MNELKRDHISNEISTVLDHVVRNPFMLAAAVRCSFFDPALMSCRP